MRRKRSNGLCEGVASATGTELRCGGFCLCLGSRLAIIPNQLAFRLNPILKFIARGTATFQVKLISANGNLFLRWLALCGSQLLCCLRGTFPRLGHGISFRTARFILSFAKANVPTYSLDGMYHDFECTAGVCGRQGKKPRRGRRSLVHFVFRLALGESGGLLYNLVDSPGARFRAAIVKDGQQLAAAARRRHALPSLQGAAIARKSQL